MNDLTRVIRASSDVTPEILNDAEEVYSGWFADELRIDWDEFIDRLGDKFGPYGNPPYDFEEYDNPAVRKIQRHVRELRNGS